MYYTIELKKIFFTDKLHDILISISSLKASILFSILYEHKYYFYTLIVYRRPYILIIGKYLFNIEWIDININN